LQLPKIRSEIVLSHIAITPKFHGRWLSDCNKNISILNRRQTDKFGAMRWFQKLNNKIRNIF